MKMEVYPPDIYLRAVIQAKDCYKLLQKMNLRQENFPYVALSRVRTSEGWQLLSLLQADDPRISKLGTLLFNYFNACTTKEGSPITYFHVLPP
jgi:hypothetical protein